MPQGSVQSSVASRVGSIDDDNANADITIWMQEAPTSFWSKKFDIVVTLYLTRSITARRVELVEISLGPPDAELVLDIEKA